MRESLEDFVVGRLRELGEEEAPMTERLRAIANERLKLIKAAEAAGIEIESVVGALPRVVNLQIERRTIPEKTIKQAVMEVLKGKVSGMTALEILAEINKRFSVDYPRTSLSPQLSRLKAEGKIRREGNTWRIANALAYLTAFPKQTDIEDTLK